MPAASAVLEFSESQAALWRPCLAQGFDADQSIVDAATGARALPPDELQRVLEHVAQASFDPSARERVRGRLAGVVWMGRVLAGSDELGSEELHYLWHVVRNREWPDGTSLAAYLESIRQVILDATSGVLTHRYQGVWTLGIVRRSGNLRGPGGHDWVLLEYRVERGHWLTAYQPERGLQTLESPRWSDIRWLRSPMRSSELNIT